MAIKVNFAKIALEKYDPAVEYDSQMTGLKFSLVEEISDEDGKFQFAGEKQVKLRNFFAHNDLLKTFDKLRSHLALICEISPLTRVDESDLNKPDAVAPGIFATQIVFTGSAENAGVVIVGFKMLANDRQLNLVTPNVNLGADDYEFASELLNLIQEIETEARKAYVERKRKIIQGSLFDDEPDGGTDDEDSLQGDPKQIFGKMKKGLAAKGVKVEFMANPN